MGPEDLGQDLLRICDGMDIFFSSHFFLDIAFFCTILYPHQAIQFFPFFCNHLLKILKSSLDMISTFFLILVSFFLSLKSFTLSPFNWAKCGKTFLSAPFLVVVHVSFLNSPPTFSTRTHS